MRPRRCSPSVWASLALACAATLAFSANALAESLTFTPAGGETQPFTVPQGVTLLAVTAVGGAGQPGDECDAGAGGEGGAGAKVQATLSVSAGETLYVGFLQGSSEGRRGGEGSGALGCPEGGPAGNGGTASDVRTVEPEPGSEGESLQSRLLVAGGGGGGGSSECAGCTGGSGGSAEAIGGAGGRGIEGSQCAPGEGAGGGATKGGYGGAPAPNSPYCAAEYEAGRGGQLGYGGAARFAHGGGGGGGYYGGGAGGGGGPGGGGGAGSSFVEEAAKSTSIGSGGGEAQAVSFTYARTPGMVETVTGSAGKLTTTSATLNAKVNPNGQIVTECELEYGTSTKFGSSAPCAAPPGKGTSPVTVSAALKGLKPGTLYDFRIVARNAVGRSFGAAHEFTTPSAPIVLYEGAEAAGTSALVYAGANTAGEKVTSCRFEYGTTNKYGLSATCTEVSEPGRPLEASAKLKGLKPKTTYHFRISATNATGTGRGSDETFETEAVAPPTVKTGDASPVAQSTATLNATVNPNGAAVSSCRFEYGTSTKYGASVPCAKLPGSGTSLVEVSALLKNLKAKTSYHFRITATGVGGTSKGPDEEFTTAAST